MPIPDMLIAFGVFGKTLNLHVQQNPIKYKYFVIIAAILLSLGVLGGWVIGGQQELQQGEIAPHSVRLLLSALEDATIGQPIRDVAL